MKKTFLFLMTTLLFCIGSSAFNNIKAQEWTVERWVDKTEFGFNAPSTYDGNFVEISNTYGFKLWVGIKNNYSDGVIVNNNYIATKEGNIWDTYYTYTARNDHRPSSPQPLVLPEKIYIDNIGTLNIIGIEDNVFYNIFEVSSSTNLIESGNTLNDNISSITIPSTITTIGANVFNFNAGENFVINCNATTPPTIVSSTFNESAYRGTLNIPKGSEEAYKANEHWNKFFTYTPPTEDPITLIPPSSDDNITTCDKVTFKVMQDDGTTTGKNVTASAIIYQVNEADTIALPDSTFTTSKAGEYTFYAMKGSVKSENIIRYVDEAPYVLEASTTNILANGNDTTSFSVTQCGKTVEGFTFYVNGEDRNGYTFSTAELGEYTVYATNGEIKTDEITIYATEWKVTGWVTENRFVNSTYSKTYGSNPTVAEIYDGNFKLWVLIDNNNYGIIINNNIELVGDGYNKTYIKRSGHRPNTRQPLSIPETINVGLFNDNYDIVTIREIASDVFCNVYDYTGLSDSGNELNDSISSLTIPSTITKIGNKAFDFAYGEGFTITSKATTPPEIGDYTFGRESEDNYTTDNYRKTLYVPSSSLEDYKNADYWELFFVNGKMEVDPGSIIQYNGDGNWTDTINWSNRELPTETDEVTINGNVKINTNVNVNVININENYSLTIQGEKTLSVNNIINKGNIVIEDGGQLYYNGSEELTVTVEKNIEGYGDDDVKYGWYTISSPVYSDYDGELEIYIKSIEEITNLIPDDDRHYDLYRYNEIGKENSGWWDNYKEKEPVNGNDDEEVFSSLVLGRGYLYASSTDISITFSGKIKTNSINQYCTSNNSNLDFRGFNLIGNPFTHNITLDNITGLDIAEGFYTVTNAGTWESHNSTDNIKPTQGALIKITEKTSGEYITIAEEAIAEETPRSNFINNGSINIVVSNDKYSDNAIVSFSEGKGLNKFPHLNKEAHEVYVIDNETKYGVATMNDDVTTIPVGFKANTMGEYTIAVKAQNCKFNNMTLIDKMTGVKTNLLTDSYTFMATTNDNPNRFTLTLNADNDTDNDFIYINNNEMIINNIEGNGLVQIYDVMGRSVATYNVSGSANISMETLSNGVYIVRMIDANGVKTQKVVNN